MNIDVIEPLTWLHLHDHQKITALQFTKGKLYLGLSDGGLEVYTIKLFNKEQNRSEYTPSLRLPKSLQESKNLFKNNDQLHTFEFESSFRNTTLDNSAVNRISIIPNVSTAQDKDRDILLISNLELIRVYEAIGTSINLVQEIEDSKNYVDFVNVNLGQTTLLLTGVKKKLNIYELNWKSRNTFEFEKVNELMMNDKIQAINPLPFTNKNQVIVGLINDFVILDLDDDYKIHSVEFDEMTLGNFMHGTTFKYFGLSNTGPVIRILPINEKEVLLIKDTQSAKLVAGDHSANVIQSPVKFLTVPLYVTLLDPCYILVIHNKKIEIIDLESGDLIQRFQHNINSSSISASHANNEIFLSSGADTFYFNVLDCQYQIEQYLNYDVPKTIKRRPRDYKSDLKLIGITKSISLVSKLDSSNIYFEDPKGSNEKNKQLVLRDLYTSKAIHLFNYYFKYHEALAETASEWMISYRDILPLFPDFLNGEKRIMRVSGKEYSNESNTSNTINKITLEEIQSTSLGHTTADSGTENEIGDTQKIERTSSATHKELKTVSEASKSNDIRKFNKAVNNLIIYFTEQRRIHANFFGDNSDASVKWKGIDITPFDIYPFMVPDDLHGQLNQIASIIDTSLFLCYYYTKPMLLGPLLRLPNNKCDARIVHECLLSNLHEHNKQPSFIKELLDFYYGRNLHKDALEMLHKLAHENSSDHDDDLDDFLQGTGLTVQYLQKLKGNELDLIFEYAEWVIKENKDTAFRDAKLIFMNDSYECESYDHFKVFEFFINTIKNDDIAIRHLEWLLFESDIIHSDDTSKPILKLHSKLCLLYLQKLIDIESDKEIGASPYYVKLNDILKNSNKYEPWTVLNAIPKTEDMFLRLTTFIYKRLGEHDKAIDVLFNQLEDLDSAMNYCSEIYYQPHNKLTGEGLLHKLLDDLLQHPSENVSSIEKLLYSQGSKMSILRILTSLPNTFPLFKLSAFLSENMRSSNAFVHDTAMANQLYKVGTIKLQDKLHRTQSESYTIDNAKQLCSICNKQLGYSVLSVDKNHQISHYGCYQREQLDTT